MALWIKGEMGMGFRERVGEGGVFRKGCIFVTNMMIFCHDDKDP